MFMARKPRIDYEGAFYHVIVRGNQRQRIFKDATDYQKYLQFLSTYKQRYRFFIYSYMLMSNHVHLLIEVQSNPLSKILQGINQSYTMYFNRRYKTVGHLFQGRYKAILCDRDEYLLALVKYIHLNPVRAKIANRPEGYIWSSYNHYTKKIDGGALTDTDQVLRTFSEDKATARKLFKDFMETEAQIKKDDIYRTVDQRILGGEEFVEKVMDRYTGKIHKGIRCREHSLSEIAKGIEKARGVTLKQIRGRSKTGDISPSRKILCLVAKEYGYRGGEIARYIRRDPAVVSIAMKNRKVLEKDIEKIIQVLLIQH